MIFVAGASGLVGSAIVRRLQAKGAQNLLTPSHKELDLREQGSVNAWFAANRPKYVYLAAGTVGGILANSSRPAAFIYDNLLIHTNVIDAAYRNGVRRMLYLGSSCIYPRECPQPMREGHLLTSSLEPTNEPYAIAKIAGIRMCQAYRAQYGCDFISATPTNLYGPGDNFDLENSHVLPALIRKFHESRAKGGKEVIVWGSGTPRREFLHVDDLAAACLFLMENYSESEHINIGTGQDLTIRDLAELVKAVIHPEVGLVFDQSKPDGTPRKLLDISKIRALGWKHRIELREGILQTYRWYIENLADT
jgi:GDP-L-fucose synthase